MITEIVTFQLKVAGSLDDPSSSANQVIREFLMAELAADGASNAYYGQLIEKPDTVVVFVEWNSMDDREKFTSSPNYESHVHHLQSIIADEKLPQVLHVPFGDSPSAALGADSKVGATELVFFYFPSTLTSSDREAIMSLVDKMRPVLERSESIGVYDGWALEEAVFNPGPQATDGETSQVYVNIVGWVDVDAHMRFQGSEDFQSNIHHLLGIKDIRYTELNHVKLYAM
ncbi:MAG: hypothetical protein MMC33_004005 [Icmadophila ericetorum]|nr:hypothetical protein [Icmadophila ericetorum]